jgi:hypothetical protein
MFKKLLIFYLLIYLFENNCEAQNDSPVKIYNQLLRKAESYIIENKLDSAIIVYKNALTTYNFPFIKDIRQAAFISCLAKDKPNSILFIKEAILNGLPKVGYEGFVEEWKHKNPNDIDISINYDSLHNIYLKGINEDKLFAFLYLDKKRDDFINFFNLDRDVNKRQDYYDSMCVLRNKYIDLVNSIGFPAEREIGRFLRYSTKRIIKKSDILFEKEFETKFISPKRGKKMYVTELSTSFITFKPSYWFLSHYVNPFNLSDIDEELFKIISVGFDSLKIDPYIIANILESTREPKNEFAMTYYSRLIISISNDCFKKYHLTPEVSNQVNENRKKYFIRTLEDDFNLIKYFYKLKTGNELPEEFTQKDIECIQYEIKLFTNYF